MKRWMAIALVVAVALAAWTTGCQKGKEPAGSIDREPTPIRLEQADKEWLLNATRTLLAGGPEADLAAPPANVAGLCGREVWISAFPHGGRNYADAIGRGSCVVDGLRDAAGTIADQWVFSSTIKGQLDQTRIKIDILDEDRKIKRKYDDYESHKSQNYLGRMWEPGWWGAAAVVEGTLYRVLPDTVIYKGWGLHPKYRDNDNKGRYKRRDVANRQLRALAEMADVNVDVVERSNLRRFTTVGFIEEKPGSGSLDLMRGNVLLPREFTREQMLDSAIRAGDQLLYHQTDEGTYGYWYMTDDDKFSRSYGVVRHAGTVWGLFRLYNVTGEKRFLESARKGLAWMRTHAKSPAAHRDLAIIEEGPNSAAMGTMALCAMALIEMPKEEMTPDLVALEQQLGNTLLFMTNDDGRIYKTFRQAEMKRLPAEQPIYFPGEAALALIHLYNKHGDAKWLDAARRICDYQIDDFVRTGKPDNWIIQCLSLLYRITKEPRYLEYGIKTADYNVDAHWSSESKEIPRVSAPYYDYVGGFANSTPPRSTPAGSRTEAMDEAYHLAKAAGDEAAMKRYGDCIWRSFWFMRNHQFRPENAFYVKNPEAVVGGIKGGLIDNNIRIDYNQHIIMAILNGLAVFDDRPGVSTTTVFDKP